MVFMVPFMAYIYIWYGIPSSQSLHYCNYKFGSRLTFSLQYRVLIDLDKSLHLLVLTVSFAAM